MHIIVSMLIKYMHTMTYIRATELKFNNIYINITKLSMEISPIIIEDMIYRNINIYVSISIIIIIMEIILFNKYTLLPKPFELYFLL